MPKPTGRIPYAVFGLSTGEELSLNEIADIDRQRCPFLKSVCTKFRKSNPAVKIGSGIVLDPYMGNGTTAVAAIARGCHYLGIDIDPVYCGLSKKRIAEYRKGRLYFAQCIAS